MLRPSVIMTAIGPRYLLLSSLNIGRPIAKKNFFDFRGNPFGICQQPESEKVTKSFEIGDEVAVTNWLVSRWGLDFRSASLSGPAPSSRDGICERVHKVIWYCSFFYITCTRISKAPTWYACICACTKDLVKSDIQQPLKPSCEKKYGTILKQLLTFRSPPLGVPF